MREGTCGPFVSEGVVVGVRVLLNKGAIFRQEGVLRVRNKMSLILPPPRLTDSLAKRLRFPAPYASNAPSSRQDPDLVHDGRVGASSIQQRRRVDAEQCQGEVGGRAAHPDFRATSELGRNCGRLYRAPNELRGEETLLISV